MHQLELCLHKRFCSSADVGTTGVMWCPPSPLQDRDAERLDKAKTGNTQSRACASTCRPIARVYSVDTCLEDSLCYLLVAELKRIWQQLWLRPVSRTRKVA